MLKAAGVCVDIGHCARRFRLMVAVEAGRPSRTPEGSSAFAQSSLIAMKQYGYARLDEKEAGDKLPQGEPAPLP